jgi:hypothetical protein
MSLSGLPGISAADDTVISAPLPVRFISFNAKCEGSKILISWKTAQEQNSSHYDVEESADGVHWTVIGTQIAAGSSSSDNSYSFTVNNPLQNSFYRVAEYDLDGRVNYTGIIQSSCNTPDVFRLWPNPTRDKVVVNLVTDHESQAMVKIFDSKGSLVKEQRTNVVQGSNQFTVDLTSLASGIYQVQVNWNNGQNKNAVRIVKL